MTALCGGKPVLKYYFEDQKCFQLFLVRVLAGFRQGSVAALALKITSAYRIVHGKARDGVFYGPMGLKILKFSYSGIIRKCSTTVVQAQPTLEISSSTSYGLLRWRFEATPRRELVPTLKTTNALEVFPLAFHGVSPVKLHPTDRATYRAVYLHSSFGDWGAWSIMTGKDMTST